MQNRYAGDIGDYFKLALLRAASNGRSLGVAWYLHPDEGHNEDGKHIAYLSKPQKWRSLDPELFDALSHIVGNTRSVNAIRESGVLSAQYFSDPLSSDLLNWRDRAKWRSEWFLKAVRELGGCDIVFADPDNGLVDDDPRRQTRKQFAKQIPLAEAIKLAEGRCAIIYHHNTRRKGGHDAEVDHWIAQFPCKSLAIRATAFSCRTFFVLNPDRKIVGNIEALCNRWSNHSVRLHGS